MKINKIENSDKNHNLIGDFFQQNLLHKLSHIHPHLKVLILNGPVTSFVFVLHIDALQ